MALYSTRGRAEASVAVCDSTQTKSMHPANSDQPERRLPPANRGRIVVAKVGLDGHDRGARVLARMLREEGFEVVYLGLRHSPEQVAEEAMRRRVDVVGLSILSGAHIELSAAVRSALDACGGAHIAVAVGGLIPQGDAEELGRVGVARAFHTGADLAQLSAAMDELVERSRDRVAEVEARQPPLPGRV